MLAVPSPVYPNNNQHPCLPGQRVEKSVFAAASRLSLPSEAVGGMGRDFFGGSQVDVSAAWNELRSFALLPRQECAGVNSSNTQTGATVVSIAFPNRGVGTSSGSVFWVMCYLSAGLPTMRVVLLA
mmetsp:Transcript_41226/g.101394  ORF Transcript_41226/g.101394 Transcript_41226/m.101394 type:complete len:126 (+) Transcript_41226:996-1373(+)